MARFPSPAPLAGFNVHNIHGIWRIACDDLHAEKVCSHCVKRALVAEGSNETHQYKSSRQHQSTMIFRRRGPIGNEGEAPINSAVGFLDFQILKAVLRDVGSYDKPDFSFLETVLRILGTQVGSSQGMLCL